MLNTGNKQRIKNKEIENKELKKKILSLLEHSVPKKKIARTLRITVPELRQKCEEFQIGISKNAAKWEKEKKKIYDLIYNKLYTTKEISDLYGVNKSTISKLKDLWGWEKVKFDDPLLRKFTRTPQQYKQKQYWIDLINLINSRSITIKELSDLSSISTDLVKYILRDLDLYDQYFNLSLEEKFLTYVKKTDDDKCWEWKGGYNPNGRCVFSNENNPAYAYRVAYELFVGPIPKDKCVCHTCDNPGCVNPKHLWIGTRKDNFRDAINKGRAKPFGSRASVPVVGTHIETGEIRKWESISATAKSFNAKPASIAEALKGNVKTYKGWKLKKDDEAKISIKVKSGSSKYRGVYWHKKDRLWRAVAMINGKQTYLGSSANEIEAAKIYDAAMKKYRKEEAILNFPNPTT